MEALRAGVWQRGCVLVALIVLGESGIARADIPGFSFDATQVGPNIEIHPRVFSSEFYGHPPCEFEIYRRARDSEPWDKLFEGELADGPLTCEPVCYVDEWGEERCYPPDTKSVCACETFVDLCPEPGGYEYWLIVRDVFGPWGTHEPVDLSLSREATVEEVDAECLAPTGAITGTWWPREHHDGCDTTGNPGVPHLLVLALFLASIGLSSFLRRVRQK